jgi:hypothetical protein
MVEKLMSKLGCTEEEALDIISKDKEIEKGADPFPLTTEQKAAAKKMASTGSRKKGSTGPKTRKKDDEKAIFITEIAEFLQNKVDLLEITNAERQIFFKMGENSYELTLIKKRK